MSLVKVAAFIIPSVLYGAATFERSSKFPNIAGFGFERHELPAIGTTPALSRPVHPDLQHIEGWISSVGAAVAAFDYDQDGLNNDYCLVDPRFDTVTVGPVPTTGQRFAAFELPGFEDPGEHTAPMGCLPFDADEDGRQDIVVYYWGRTPSLHLSSERFSARDLVPTEEIWNTNAASVADLNGDGRLDLVFGNYFPDGQHILGQTGSVTMQHSMSRAQNAGRNRLFVASQGIDGIQFTDASSALDEAMKDGWTLGLGATDLDGDGLPELYFSNDFGPDYLLHNRSQDNQLRFVAVTGHRGFTTPRSRVLGRDSFKGMGVDFGDLDGDGNLDLFISNIAEDYALMESHLLFLGTGDSGEFLQGRAPFVEASGTLGVARSAWSWDARIADFNNDGQPELLQATGFLRGEIDRWPELHEVAMGNDELLRFAFVWPRFAKGDDLSGDKADAFFVANEDGEFSDIGHELGFATSTVSRGIALADVDGDGDQDALIARQWMPSILLKNTGQYAAQGVVLDLRFENENGSTRPAIGVSATLSSSDHPLVLRDAIIAGDGHSGKNAPELHFGLGGWPQGAEIFAELEWTNADGQHKRRVAIEPGRLEIILSPRIARTLRHSSTSEDN